jgi:16S rRNA (guanine527-N7)-methyltransferase
LALEERLLGLGRCILEINRTINLTGARDLPTLVEDHLLDSLSLIPPIRESVPAVPGVRRLLVDVGSGGGFPALPLALVLDRLDVLCVESVGKKARALADLCAATGLTRVTVLNDRAELAAHDPRWREQANWATARGVGSLATVCELTLPFLRVGGTLLAQKGAEASVELNDALPAIARLGGRAERIVSVGPPRPQRKRMVEQDSSEYRLQPAVLPTERSLKAVLQTKGLRFDSDKTAPGISRECPGRERLVVIVSKIGPTPDGFPRRPGLPAKRPLKGDTT